MMVHELARPGKIKVQKARMTGCLTSDPVDTEKIGLYWNISASCEPIDYFDDEWEPGLLFDGLLLEGFGKVSLSDTTQPQGECSFYLGMHHQAKKWEITIELDAERAGGGRMTYDVLIDYCGMDRDADPALRLSGGCNLELGEIAVPRNMFFPKPTTAKEASILVEPYFPAIKDWHHIVAEDADGWPIPDPHGFSFAFTK